MTVADAVRPWAYAPPPQVDEPLDAWIERVATVVAATRPALYRSLGLPTHSSFSATRDLSDAQVKNVCKATGLTADELEVMTLARWESIGLRPRTNQRGHGSGAWARGRGSRACPTCLNERQGIPRLQWHLHWSFACVRHGCLLQPVVLEEKDARAVPPGPELWHCGEDHPAVRTQAAIDDILEEPSLAVSSLGRTRPAWEYIRDLAALTRMAAVAMGKGGTPEILAALPDAKRPVWAPMIEKFSFTGSASPAKRLQEATQQPTVMALAATLARDALVATSISEASTALGWLSPTAREEAVHHARSRQLSWPLVRVLDDSDARSRPARLLILRFGLARFDDGGARRAPLDAAKVPASCWRSVALGSSTDLSEIGQVATSAALMAIGSTRGVRSSLDRIDHPHLAARVRADWQRTFGIEDDASFDLLLTLHRLLVDGEVPINYARRRRSFRTPPEIGSRKARRMARDLDAPLTDRLIRHATWFVYELLTGSNILLSSTFLDLWAAQRIAYRRQRAAWIDHHPKVLQEVAEQELLRLRINEPVTWEPQRAASSWRLPPPVPHTLPGWHERPRTLRQGVRLQSSDTTGYALDEAVALAARGSTQTARHISRNLNRFAVVAGAGSLRAGAKVLGITSGTLSVQMADLERDLATTLLDRTGPAVALTGDGRHLLRLIEQSHDDLRRAARNGARSRSRSANLPAETDQDLRTQP